MKGGQITLTALIKISDGLDGEGGVYWIYRMTVLCHIRALRDLERRMCAYKSIYPC